MPKFRSGDYLTRIAPGLRLGFNRSAVGLKDEILCRDGDRSIWLTDCKNR